MELQACVEIGGAEREVTIEFSIEDGCVSIDDVKENGESIDYTLDERYAMEDLCKAYLESLESEPNDERPYPSDRECDRAAEAAYAYRLSLSDRY